MKNSFVKSRDSYLRNGLSMKPKLEFINNSYSDTIVAVLVDTSLQTGYPANFVCILPANLRRSNFKKLFGKKSKEVALQLLKEALENPQYNNNPDVKPEIEKRIAYLNLNALTTAECQECGEIFEYRKYFRVRRFCDNCSGRR